MAEKPRAPRKPEAAGCTIASTRQFTKGSDRRTRSGLGTIADIEEHLSKARQELEKNQKITRSLLRNSARAEAEHRGLQEIFALVTDHGTDLIFRLNRHGKFLESSPSCKALLGIAPENMKGRAFQDLASPEDQQPLRAYFQRVLGSSLVVDTVIHLRHPDHGVPALELFCKAVPHPQTQILEIIGIARPLHPPKAATAIKDNLSHSLAHELNQPLTALAIGARACGQLALAGEVDMAELIQAINLLALQAERAGELVRRMRHMASGGEPSWSWVDVQDMVNGALELCQVELDKEQVVVELHIAIELPKIKMDRIQIEQVLVNLIRNAIEAMNEMPVAERVLVVAASRNGGELVIVVSDTGRGVSPAIAERLFQPYQTTKTQGMGLGLAISRAILQAHAGRLWVEEARGPGATFCLALPLVSNES